MRNVKALVKEQVFNAEELVKASLKDLAVKPEKIELPKIERVDPFTSLAFISSGIAAAYDVLERKILVSEEESPLHVLIVPHETVHYIDLAYGSENLIPQVRELGNEIFKQLIKEGLTPEKAYKYQLEIQVSERGKKLTTPELAFRQLRSECYVYIVTAWCADIFEQIMGKQRPRAQITELLRNAYEQAEPDTYRKLITRIHVLAFEKAPPPPLD